MTGINLKASAKVVGWLLILEAAMLLMPAAVSLIYGGRDFLPFILAAAITAFSGVAVSWPLHRVKIQLRRREGYLLTAIVWVLFSLFGMIPFLLCDHPLSVADAYFETMSGFTTTGATVISDVESYSHAILFWRALMQWLGGLGIVLFLLALLPALNQSGGITMYNAETTGITHDKLHPRIRQTAGSLWQLYGILTVMLIFLLWLGPMDIFDAVCQSLAAISTGGFSTRNSSIAAWNSSYVNAVITLFMFVAGVNFVLLYGAVHGRARDLFRNDVFRSYLGIVLGAFLLLSIVN
ncbi:MAG: TrkH family potassium uptake protein, partial [Muribaculaceae bacterium]|nr:TrkH family potassium uptake protein [Muribaculaceae bacterium]